MPRYECQMVEDPARCGDVQASNARDAAEAFAAEQHRQWWWESSDPDIDVEVVGHGCFRVTREIAPVFHAVEIES